MAQLASDIRGVMIPLTDAKILLPNASVSEVITFGNPQEIDDAPEWIYGFITWRGWRIPLFSFSLLAGQAQEETTSGAKVAILKALGGDAQMPYMALLAQGFPRLTTITEENLLLDGDQDNLPDGVKHTVRVNDDVAFVPDMDGIEAKLVEIIS
ncbi:MAG: chemotaxis protein CheW [Xanthomonadales bacterium]|nr:chemotaxis protein CheW [Xanthomonadales bacterium]